MDNDKIEIITATGAAVHALQVLSGEVKRYIKIEDVKAHIKVRFYSEKALMMVF